MLHALGMADCDRDTHRPQQNQPIKGKAVCSWAWDRSRGPRWMVPDEPLWVSRLRSLRCQPVASCSQRLATDKPGEARARRRKPWVKLWLHHPRGSAPAKLPTPGSWLPHLLFPLLFPFPAWFVPPSYWVFPTMLGFPGSSGGKESACNVGHPSSIPGSGRCPGEGKVYPLQYSWASLESQPERIRLQCGRPEFDPWVGKIPWRRERLLQYSGLENPMDCVAHGITESWTWLSDFPSTPCPARLPSQGREALLAPLSTPLLPSPLTLQLQCCLLALIMREQTRTLHHLSLFYHVSLLHVTLSSQSTQCVPAVFFPLSLVLRWELGFRWALGQVIFHPQLTPGPFSALLRLALFLRR